MSLPAGMLSLLLDFQPKPRMTRWYEPFSMTQLVIRIWRTRRMADQREQRVDQPTRVFDYAQTDDDFWFDYVADLGDAFDPTMCIAWHLGRRRLQRADIDPRLSVEPEFALPDLVPEPPADDVTAVLPRGRLLIMGGDEVYPSGSDRGYRNQTLGPYGLAWEADPTDPLAADGGIGEAGLLALPANHDWYGGIEPFRTAFCRQAKFGGWRTAQTASWWAARLAHDWWVWGVDTALNGTINPAQFEYFRAVRNDMPSDARLIVCTPVPMWRLRERHIADLDKLTRFLLGLGVEPEVYLSGDYHIAALHRRDRADGGTEWHLTSGGGGAFQHPVHNLDREIPNRFGGLPAPEVAGDPPFRLLATWPSNTESRLGSGGWRHLLFDRAAGSLIATLTAIQLPLMWLAGAGDTSATADARSVADTAADHFLPVGLLTTAALVALTTFGLARPTTAARGAVSWARSVGLFHGIAQSGVFAGAQLLANLALRRTGGSLPAAVVITAAAAVIGAVASIAVLGTYLSVANRQFRMHDNESYSARHSGDNRHFVRFRISPDGTLFGYVIALRRTGREWAEGLRGEGPVPPPSASKPELTDVRFRTKPSQRLT